jgi:DHA2 family multidrug resistance protein
MGYATSVISSLRNIGASIGISIVTADLTRTRQAAQDTLAAHVKHGNPALNPALNGMKAYFAQHGSGPVRATQQALALIYQEVQQQTAVLSYLHGFRLLAVVFGIAAPLAWIMKPGPVKRRS